MWKPVAYHWRNRVPRAMLLIDVGLPTASWISVNGFPFMLPSARKARYRRRPSA